MAEPTAVQEAGLGLALVGLVSGWLIEQEADRLRIRLLGRVLPPG